MAEVSGEGGVGFSVDLISGETRGNAPSLTVSGSLKEEGKGSPSRPRQSVRPSLDDADESIDLLHGADPLKLEHDRPQNELTDKDRELREALSQVKALKVSERLLEKTVEELTEGLKKVEEKLKLTESLLESKNLEIKRLNDEKKASMAAQFAAEATLRRVHSGQKDDGMPPYYPHMPPPYYPNYPPSSQNPPLGPPPYYPNYAPSGQNLPFLPPPYYPNYQHSTPPDAGSQPSQHSESVSDTELPHPQPLRQVPLVRQPPHRTGPAKKILWSMEEEETLMAAYVELTLHPAIGNNQRSSAFWVRVAECLERDNPSGNHRTGQQCKSHWHMVKRPITAFSKKFNEVYKEHHSEWNDELMIVEAHRRYSDSHGQKRFTYMHMWYKIRDQPKWAPVPPSDQPTKKARINESGAYTSSSGPVMPISVDDVQQEIRPVDQKTVKRKSKPKGSESTSHDPNLEGDLLDAKLDQQTQLDKIAAARMEQVEVDRVKAEVDRQKNEVERQKNWPHLYKILLMPTDGMLPETLAMHEKMCANVRVALGLN